MNTMHELMKLASLEILEHDVHTRNEMNTRDRSVPYYIMSYIKSGQAVLRVRGEEYVTGPGSIVLVPPYTLHDHYINESRETLFFWWDFKFTVYNVIDLIRLLRLPMVSTLKHPDSFEATFLRYCEINRAEDSLANLLRRKAQAIEVLALILDDLIAENNGFNDASVIEPFPHILLDVITPSSKELTLRNLSEKYHLNPNYISNRFKEYFGVSPIVMRREIILERAKQFLRTTSLSVNDIATAMGYCDIYSFSHYFAAKVGVSPTTYRKSFM